MAHVPHFFVAPPWEGDELPLPAASQRHLERVLRRSAGDEVTYTDGAGTRGTGTYAGDGMVVRGCERGEPPPAQIVVAAAPPQAAERCRFMVEKCAELGASAVVWLTTRYGDGRPPKADKARAWCIAALQQSQGSYLTDVRGPIAIAELDPAAAVVADASGHPGASLALREPLTIVVGPEGGFAANEIPPELPRWRLADRILRCETAAVVAVAAASELVLRSGAGRPGPDPIRGA